MTTYAGIDLHSSNNYMVVIDEDDKRLFGKRLANILEAIALALERLQRAHYVVCMPFA